MSRVDKSYCDQLSLFDDSSLESSTPDGSAPHFPAGEAQLVADDCKTLDRESFWDKNVQPSIDQVEENADEDWRDVARDCLHTLAETRDELTSDDLVELLETKPVETHNLAALGPIFLRASNAGWIENTGRMIRTRIARRHRKITVWKSRLRETNVCH